MRFEEKIARRYWTRLAAEETLSTQAAIGLLERLPNALQAIDDSKRAVERVLASFPDDKNVPLVLKQLEKMKKGYEKEKERARAAIKKDTPPLLKKVTNDTAKLLKAKLVNPDILKIIPGTIKNVPSMTLRLEDPSLIGLTPHGFLGIPLFMDPTLITPNKVSMYLRDAYRTQVISSAAEVVEAFTSRLRGWPGFKGRDAEISKRKEVATKIQTVLNQALSRIQVYGRDEAQISSDGFTIEGAYRSSLPKEGAYEVGKYEYKQMVSKEIADYRKILDPALKPFADSIENVSIYDEEKSWIRTEIDLR
jgi:hypothetical protein